MADIPNTLDRIPTRICDFISRNVYSNMLKSQHSITAASACKFVDVIAGKEQAKGKSWFVSLCYEVLVYLQTN